MPHEPASARVIGLGWFGEIHGDPIAGVANIELANKE